MIQCSLLLKRYPQFYFSVFDETTWLMADQSGWIPHTWILRMAQSQLCDFVAVRLADRFATMFGIEFIVVNKMKRSSYCKNCPLYFSILNVHWKFLSDNSISLVPFFKNYIVLKAWIALSHYVHCSFHKWKCLLAAKDIK